MNAILSEKEYQRYVIDRLVESGYEERPASEFDRLHALNPNALMTFLEATQLDTLDALRKIYKDKTQETILSAISTTETAKSGSRLEILKHGLSIGHYHIDLKSQQGACKEISEEYLHCIRRGLGKRQGTYRPCDLSQRHRSNGL